MHSMITSGGKCLAELFASFRLNHFISFFQNLQKKAESLIEKYEFDYTKALKDVDYVNVNNVTGKGEVNVSMLTLESLERCGA